MWWKQHKWKVILPVLILVILAGVFWYGGNAPGARGWTVTSPETDHATMVQDPPDTAEPVQTPEQEPSAVPEPEETAEEHTPESDTKEEPAKATPEQTAEPAASKQPEQAQPSNQPEMAINPETGKDKYQTDPVPEGKPLPVEP